MTKPSRRVRRRWSCYIPDLRKRIPRRVGVTLVFNPVGDAKRDVLAPDVLDPGQRAVDPRGNTARRPNVAVDDPARLQTASTHGIESMDSTHLGDPDDIRASARAERPRELVSRRASTVEHAGAREKSGAGADRDEVLERRILCRDKVVVRLELGDVRASAGTA